MDYTSSYSLLGNPAKRNWDAMLRELGFHRADAEHLKGYRIAIFSADPTAGRAECISYDDLILAPP
jgi:hypothetical protein